MNTSMSAQHTPGSWRIVKVQNKGHETRLAVARPISGGKFEYVHSASGRVSTFCTEKGAKVALRAAIAKATGSAT